MRAKLTLVGAGPGDPELITMKGVRAIEAADVILYDALVHPDLLEYARPNTHRVYVGKRGYKKSTSQDEINRLIVENALKYGHVVRLKGGDPFVFARGHEEISFAQTFGIPTEAIVGVSSINLPGLYDIPLTLRGTNESFWVVTTTTAKGSMSNDVHLVAQSTATGVFLMGLGKLHLIAEAYKANDRGDLPVAIISKGSLPDAQVITATIDTVVEVANRSTIQTPAIIVVGEVVGDKLSPVDLEHFYQHQSSYEKV